MKQFTRIAGHPQIDHWDPVLASCNRQQFLLELEGGVPDGASLRPGKVTSLQEEWLFASEYFENLMKTMITPLPAAKLNTDTFLPTILGTLGLLEAHL